MLGYLLKSIKICTMSEIPLFTQTSRALHLHTGQLRPCKVRF
jgi:hypothetical protein